MADNKSQREYNDLLKMTQSMLGSIGKSMDDIAKKSDKRNKSLEYEASFSAELVKSLQSQADIEKLIADIKTQKLSVSKKDFGANSELAKQYKIQLTGAESILKQRLKDLDVLNKTQDVVGQYGDDFKSKIDGVFGKIKDIPIIGKALGKMFQPFQDRAKKIVDGVGRQFMNGFSKSFLKARESGLNTFQSFSKGLSGGVKKADIFLKRIGMLPLRMLLGIGAVLALVKVGFDGFKKLDAAGAEFRKSTGLLNSQTKQLEGNLRNVTMNYASLGVSASDVASAAAEFTNEFKGIEQPSREVLGSMVSLNKNFGVGNAEAAKLNKIFQNIGGLSAEQSQYLVGQTAQMARMAGVAPSKVIQDMANSSEYAYKYFQGSPQELQKAAIQAAKLGTSIAEAGKAADNLLDFQSSITSELEANAMLGANLNLSQARYLAANGKAVEAQQAINDQVAQLGDLTKLNTFEQEALSKATGMEFSSLVDQQRIRERFGDLQGDQLAAAMALADTNKDLTKISEKDLKNQTDKIAAQREFQSILENIKNEFNALGAEIQMALAPLGKAFLPVLSIIFDVVKAIVWPFVQIGKLVGWIGEHMQRFGEFLSPAVNALSAMMGFLGPIGTLLKAVASIGIIWAAYAAYASLAAIPFVGVPLGIAASAAVLAGGFGLLNGIAMGDGEFSGGNMKISSQEGGLNLFPSKNDDVVVAPGLSDYLQTQREGGGGMSVAPIGLDMSGVINELKELKSAFLSNKDVYLDKERVTASVTVTQEKSGRTNNFGVDLA